MNKQKNILCIHDLCTVGRSSLSVIIPAISAMGLQACALPSAILSSHFYSFENVAAAPQTQFIKEALSSLAENKVSFDCVYTGYLIDEAQVELCMGLLGQYPNALKVVDPVMGDNGKLYSGISAAHCEAVKKLCHMADIITPNTTEALLLLDSESIDADAFTREQLCDMSLALSQKFDVSCVITGAKLISGAHAVAGYDKSGKSGFIDMCRYTGVYFPGTGDLFAAVLCGCFLKDKSFQTACEIAINFVSSAAEFTAAEGTNEKYGLCFEPILNKLWESVN